MKTIPYISNIKASLALSLYTHKYELEYESSDGLHLGIIKLKTEYDNILLPIHVVEIDDDTSLIRAVVANNDDLVFINASINVSYESTGDNNTYLVTLSYKNVSSSYKLIIT